VSPKVSIAIPSYEQKDFLRETIESVLMQDYDNLEIVVSDNASTDGTREMLLEYEKNNPGLFKLIFQEKNLGMRTNHTSAYLGCTGQYMAWLDGDDLMLPGRIKKLVDVMESNPNCVVCIHNIEVFDSDSGKVLNNYYNVNDNFPHQLQGVENFIKFGGYAPGPGRMFRLSACPPEGFDTRVARTCDFLFLIETALHGEIKYIPEVLGRYRIHGNNITITTCDDYTDRLITLALVETKHPHLWSYTRQCRALYLYELGVQKVLQGQGEKARPLLIESLRQGWITWKWFGWFVNSWLGIRATKVRTT
jgi:glycosyltransferase involved in cell wall biosynthesis